jgi:hypothetical protein
MKLFLLNPSSPFDYKELGTRVKVSSLSVRTEVALLIKAGLIKRRTFIKEITGKGKKKIKRKMLGYELNPEFPYLNALGQLLLGAAAPSREDIVRRLKRAGNVKLIILSGIFMKNDDSEVDIMIVGDQLKKRAIERTLSALEAEIGKELSYVFFDTNEFKYRIGIYDKFVRNVLEFPHEKVLNRMGMI